MATFSIQDLSKEYGITARTIRFYEDKGLVSPERQGVTRVFSEKDKVRLELALRGRRLGFSIEEISEIIDMYDPEQPDDPLQLLYLCQKINEHRKELVNKINDINSTLDVMNELESKAINALQARQKQTAIALHGEHN